MIQRLLRLLVSPELSLLSPVLFGCLYTWPLLTSDRPSKTVLFTFIVWCLHVAVMGATHYVSRKLEQHGSATDEAHEAPAE